MTRYLFLIVLCQCFISSSVFSQPADTVVFQADFRDASGAYESAPLLPIETQPAEGLPTVDFNNLKDPKYTAEFAPRNPILKQVPGFSGC